MFFDLIERLPELLHLSWADLAKVFIGAFMVAFMAFGWVRSIRKATKAQIRAEELRREAEAARERAEFERELASHKSQHSAAILQLREQAMEADRGRQEAENDRSQMVTVLAALQARMAALESFDGKLWEQDIPVIPPTFVAATDRQTRFLAIVNLKGGVGKTTLTANIGVTLARRGHRVLLVDLDFQSSLTRLCTPSPDHLLELIRKKKTAARLLEAIDGTGLITDLAQRISHPNLLGKKCDYIAADESLAEAELRAQARWLVTKTPDARFLFRGRFHTQEILGHYDFVLFDCPPRLTTACVNALACADFLLVPVFLEQGSLEALPRTLNWLTRLPHVTRARLLGVIANRVELRVGRPINEQQTILDFLPETLKRCGCGDNVFCAIVKNSRAMIEEAANAGQIAAVKDNGAELFAGVVTEVEKGVRN